VTVFNIPVSLFNLKDLILPIPLPRKFYSRFLYLPVIFFLLLNNSLAAQNKNTPPNNLLQSKLRHLTIEDGLSQNGAFAIAQDSKGFIWVGTKDGLNKYNGYNFKVYTHDPFDSTTLSSNYIGAVFEDSRGILWVITYEGEINLMDSRTELFRKTPVTIPHMTSITEDKNGNIWIGSYRKGLFLIKREDILTSHFRVTNYRYLPGGPNSIGDTTVYSLAVDGDGVLWIGTTSGLVKLSPNTESFEYKTVLNKNTPDLENKNAISSILVYNDSTLWLGSSMGLFLFNKNSGLCKFYPFKFRHQRGKYGEGSISNIVKDYDGNLFMHLSGYLVLFNVGDFTFRNLCIT
jgi:ligand-binding sensor domain-containing protein